MRFAHAFLAAAAVALPASTLHAQAQASGTRFGVDASLADHFGLGVGAFVKFHLADMSGHPITGRVSFDYYFPGSIDDGCDGLSDLECTACGADCASASQHYWEISADGLYDIANAKSDLKPYVGAGLAYSHYSEGDFDCGGACGGIGVNILGGINFMANSKLMPFVEIKLGIGGSIAAFGGSVVSLKGGVHF
jgi:opacity protein-like surface antigen